METEGEWLQAVKRLVSDKIARKVDDLERTVRKKEVQPFEGQF